MHVMQRLEAGADLNSKGPQGRTALHLAALENHHSYLKALLAYGADVTVLDTFDNSAVDDLYMVPRRLLRTAAGQFVISQRHSKGVPGHS